jgi:F0F1-type ATP synthase membrane subunit b/b'
MSPAVANFLFEGANLLLLAAGLAWGFFAPVRRVLDEERDRQAKAEGELARARADAASLRNEAQAERESAGREIAARRAEVLEAAERDAAALLERSRGERSAERHALEQELEARREAEVAGLADDVARIAAVVVARLLASVEGPPLDSALARLACEKIRALPAEARRPAVVESARALEGPTRALLAGVLGDGFEVRVVSELGAGVRITTPAGQVDASAGSFAREAAEALRRAAGERRERADG